MLRASLPGERQRWLDVVAELPVDRRDVYFLPEYLEPFQNETDIEACCAVCRVDDALLVYPFLKVRIAAAPSVVSNGRPLMDLQSGYGYGGPAVNFSGERPEFLELAWGRFAEWCAAERVVSEFVRFHPLLDNARWAPATMRRVEDRVTIPIKLSDYPAALENTSYYRVHRQMLNKAARMGFAFDVRPLSDALPWFVPLYSETQDFLGAGDEMRFGERYFQMLADGFGSRAWLGVVTARSDILAAALVLEGESWLHSHLMGYHRLPKTAGMTNLVYHGIALEGIRRGKSVLHMGGGRTRSDDDSLYRFKKSLSPERATFWLGMRCFDPKVYDQIGREWEAQYGPRPKNYLQFYHLKAAIE